MRTSPRLRVSIARSALVALLLVALPSVGRTQQGDDTRVGSAYLPLDHWAYPALELWIARGDVTDLSPLTRPYRIADVVRAVGDMPGAELSTVEEETRRLLLDELSPGREPGLVLFGEAGGRVVPQTHPDPLQPVLDGRYGETRFLERIEVSALGGAPYVAGAVRLRRDGIYRYDPRFPGGQVTPRRDGLIADDLSLRAEDAYVELQIPWFRFSFGRMDRNWGPAPIDGFLRSANPYSQDEIGYRIGTDRVFLIGSFGMPGDFAGDTVRYLSMHRLEVRPSDRLVLGISESVVYGGPEGRLRFELTNPVGIWQIALDDGDVPHNKVGQIDAWWRVLDGLTVNASVLADATNREGSCCQMGGSAGLELTRLAPGLRVATQLSAIQSLAYRTELPWEQYSVDDVGLGWDKADLVLASIEADWFVLASLRLGARIDAQWLGEGDFRQPRPPFEELADQPRILSGEVETTLRPALVGRWTTSGDWRAVVEWDVGLSRIADYDHVAGDDRTVVTGSVAVRLLTPRLHVRLP